MPNPPAPVDCYGADTVTLPSNAALILLPDDFAALHKNLRVAEIARAGNGDRKRRNVVREMNECLQQQ